MKKNKLEEGQSFRADMQTIKEKDVKRLQETFSQFFGSKPAELKKRSSKLRNKIYYFGFLVTVFFMVIVYFTKNVNFVGF